MKDMNNRIIKFLALGVSGKMHYWELTDPQSDWVSPDEPIGEIMQFTGLKDKHGKEIYSDDLIKSFSGTYQVTFHDGCYCIIDDDKHYPLFQCPTNEIEVIGSIHSTPELLNL